MRINPLPLCIIILSILIFYGCSLAPKYQRPAIEMPVHYKENVGIWHLANADKVKLEQGPWWQLYSDPILSDLEAQVTRSNQNLKAATARYEQARANLAAVASQLFPSITGIANVNREQTSETVANPRNIHTFNDFIIGAVLSYEVDLWGRVHNSVAAARSEARASAADLAAVDLSLHADLASYYFSLRGSDKLQHVLDATVIAYQKALDIHRHRYQEGTNSAYEVDLAQNQLETAKTNAVNNRLMRAEYEHAIATLIGKAPADFSLPEIKTWHIPLVTVVPDLPSTLLERRPDVAKAEELVKAANANIGVARAAFFPQINLSTALGYNSEKISSLFNKNSLVWSLGPLPSILGLAAPATNPVITQALFDGGLRIAITKQAWARYFEIVANYRQTVLTAFQEVEDSLVSIRQLDQAYQTQMAAAQSAERAMKQAFYRYQGEIITYLDIVVVQNIAYEAELHAINIQTQREIASVRLIRALGGGWSGFVV